MVFDAAASDGSFMNSDFIAVGLNISTKEYGDILKTSLLPRMEQNFGLDDGVLMLNSVQNHIPIATQAFLGEKVPFCEDCHLSQ